MGTSAGLHKESEKIAKRVERLNGWNVSYTKRCHYRFRAPDGDLFIHSGSPSDYRGVKNLRAWLKRKGAQV